MLKTVYSGKTVTSFVFTFDRDVRLETIRNQFSHWKWYSSVLSRDQDTALSESYYIDYLHIWRWREIHWHDVFKLWLMLCFMIKMSTYWRKETKCEVHNWNYFKKQCASIPTITTVGKHINLKDLRNKKALSQCLKSNY